VTSRRARYTRKVVGDRPCAITDLLSKINIRIRSRTALSEIAKPGVNAVSGIAGTWIRYRLGCAGTRHVNEAGRTARWRAAQRGEHVCDDEGEALYADVKPSHTVVQREHELSRRLGVRATPFCVVVDPAGIVRSAGIPNELADVVNLAKQATPIAEPPAADGTTVGVGRPGGTAGRGGGDLAIQASGGRR
jgi:hypothetical protein